MYAVTGSVDVDNDRMMHHSINNSGCDDGIAQVLAQGLEVDVGCQNGGIFAVPAFDDLEEQRGVATRFLFQSVEADFVD